MHEGFPEGQNQLEKFIAMLDKNIYNLENLKKEFSSIWLKYYKPDNLNLIEDKFDRLTSYYKEYKEQVKAGELKDPKLSSRWIYNKINDSTYSKDARFRKIFSLDETPTFALLQLMGDTHAKLFINGVYVDEVYTRRSLSLVTEYGRIKLIDVAKYLRKGENTIMVESENYNRTGWAGCNIIAEITSSNSKMEIKSDETWQAQSFQDNANWKNAASREYTLIVIEPDFATKRASWIER